MTIAEVNSTTRVDEQGAPQQTLSDVQLELKYSLIELRRSKILALLSTGLSQTAIAGALGVDKSTVSRDIQEMKREAREDIRKYVQETLPFEHKKTLAVFDSLSKELWQIYIKAEDNRTRLQALGLIGDTAMKRLQLLGDAAYLEQAISAQAGIQREVSAFHGGNI